MHSPFRLLTFAVLASVLSLLVSCSEKKPATSPSVAQQPDAKEQDLRIARDAMSLEDVLARLNAGVARSKVIEEVRRRRITARVVEAGELRLAAHGAGRELIAAMKDPANVLSEAQEAAYMQLMAAKQKAQPPKGKGAGRASPAP